MCLSIEKDHFNSFREHRRRAAGIMDVKQKQTAEIKVKRKQENKAV